MTPTGIRLGRQYESKTFAVSVTDGDVLQLLPADSNRVALVVALRDGALSSDTKLIAIGPKIDGVVIPVTTLSAGHPVCNLQVVTIGSALFQEMWVDNTSGDTLVLGVTNVLQKKELPQ